MKEQWKDIRDWNEWYQISSHGNVRVKDRVMNHWRGGTLTRRGRVLKQEVSKNGYSVIRLFKGGKYIKKYIHRLVAQAFIPNYKGRDCVNHKDGDKQNNSTDNLEWVSYKMNDNHARDTGLIDTKGESNGMSKLNSSDVAQIRGLIGSGNMQKDIAKQFNVAPSVVSNIKNRKTWAHV